ncbi:uncharacterized protein BDCG_06968 [Blastomyces dermatitidis ER-3]|uniref:DUF7707 domain-containing protein n=1 Tax=Ajellomyces dermatitidis (strain ER-3 / ATCC MYA-2586) TaxID=559297 RepID=A0ABP2F4G6_AJEDR|nr:uncharacterized protein BDCG_06968 [Blastomyces dermatitidis ER-3]EEQ91848.2 hypothetical protein BDCG_06968 [Blastomyces dermatitidis ER-3]EQL34889.1 hypothetical protein BDFG_03333 [Blastomyces dermatitidis ATCC 26199]
MLLSAVVFSLSLLVTGIRAQSFNPDSVSKEQKLAWCDAQTAACPSVCKSFASVNRCSVSDLTYTCTCGDGSTPDLTKYKNTIPFFLCTETYAQCIENHPDDLSGQRACKEEQTKCMGTLDPFKSPNKDPVPTASRKKVDASKSTATPTTTTPTKTNEPAVTSNPASTLRVAGDSSVGMLIAVFIAASSLFA